MKTYHDPFAKIVESDKYGQILLVKAYDDTTGKAHLQISFRGPGAIQVEATLQFELEDYRDRAFVQFNSERAEKFIDDLGLDWDIDDLNESIANPTAERDAMDARLIATDSEQEFGESGV